MATQVATSRQPRTGGKRTSRPRPTPVPDAAANHNQVQHWKSLTRAELDELYQATRPGRIPQGDTIGTALFAGWPLARLCSFVAYRLAWQGKVFDLPGASADAGVVVNKISPAGAHLIVAKTYRGDSWMDGKPTIVIDYSGTSQVARPIRDEIREVSPGLWLGKVWLGRRRVLDFALEQHDPLNAGA